MAFNSCTRSCHNEKPLGNSKLDAHTNQLSCGVSSHRLIFCNCRLCRLLLVSRKQAYEFVHGTDRSTAARKARLDVSRGKATNLVLDGFLRGVLHCIHCQRDRMPVSATSTKFLCLNP